MSITIYQRDLLTPSQQAESKDEPNYDENLAGVDVPGIVVLLRMVAGRYREIFILSEKR